MNNLCINQVNDDIMYDADTKFVFPTINVVFGIKDINAKHRNALQEYLDEALANEFRHAEGGLYLGVTNNAIISVMYETTDMSECDDDFLISVRDFTNEELNKFVMLNGGYDALKA